MICPLGKWLILSILAVSSTGVVIPAVGVFDWEPFSVREELLLEREVAVKDKSPIFWFRDPYEDADMNGIPDREGNTGKEKGGSSRVRLSFSRYSFSRVVGERDRSSSREEGARLIIESLGSVLRGASGIDTLESIGGAVHPQINLNVEF